MAGVMHHHRKTMKHEQGNKSDVRAGQSSPTRSSSSSSVSSSSKASASQKNKDKGPKKEELMRANAELSQELENLSEENQRLKAILSAVIEKFVENSKIKGVVVPPEIDNPDLSRIPVESMVGFAEKLTAESHKSSTMEFRMEELETRVTHLNMELAKMIRLRIDVENGLDDMIADCDSVEQFKTKTRDLVRDIKSNDLFTFLESVPLELVEEKRGKVQTGSTAAQLPERKLQQRPRDQSKERPKSSAISIQLNSEKLDLTPPLNKMPGDTHIKKMHKDLRQYIVQQLSLPKGNGADWRMMGERLGIPDETIQQWRRWKMDAPMYYVLQSWSQSSGATVRLLHRHLVSPQMRCTLLAKRKILSECQTDWILMRRRVTRRLIWIQTVCKVRENVPNRSYRQTVQTQILQLLRELSDPGLHCLQTALKGVCMKESVKYDSSFYEYG